MTSCGWVAPGEVFAALAGRWSLRRTIDDGTSVSGAASFAPTDPDRCDYREDVRMALADGRVLDGIRRYLFERGATGFSVLFAQTPARLFHRIDLSWSAGRAPNLVGQAMHLCGDDRYDSRYEFRPDGTFSVRHRVRGPHKHYAIETLYTRES